VHNETRLGSSVPVRRRERMKILHVIPVLWSGAGEIVTRLCERQARHSEVTIATSACKGPLRDWPAYRRRLRDAGVRVIRIDTFSRDPQVFWTSVDSLGRFTRDWRPDVVHTHAGLPACAVACASRSPGARHVAQMYSWGEGRPAWMNDMDVWGFRQADRVVCSARRYETMLNEAGVSRRRLAYVRLGVDVTRIDAALARRRREPRDRHIGFVGRVEPRKGQLELIRAFGLAHRRMPDLHLDLVGPVADAAYAARCRAEAKRRGVAGRVTWHGYVRNVPAIVAGWRLFVSLSLDEGQGLAVQEAMAAGVPVLAVQAAGVEDYLTDGRTGILVSNRQARCVSAAMVDAFREPASLARLAAAGARLIRRDYSWEQCESAFDRLYRTANRR
jgi:glycosyltransferase involved in cell wall biosynthesis